MSINLPFLEIVGIIFFYFSIRWFFRFGIIVFIGKLLSNLKEKGSSSLKEFQEKMAKGE